MVAQVLFFGLMESRFSHPPQQGRLWIAIAVGSVQKKGSDHPFGRIVKILPNVFNYARKSLSL